MNKLLKIIPAITVMIAVAVVAKTVAEVLTEKKKYYPVDSF